MKIKNGIVLTGLALMNRLGAFFGLIGGAALLIVVGLMTAEVFCRYALHSPILGTVEYSQYLLVLVIFASLAYTQQKDKNLRIEIVTERLSPKFQRILLIISLVVALAVFMIITWRSAVVFLDSWVIQEVRYGAIPIPIWPAKLAVLVGSFLLTLQLITDLIRQVIGTSVIKNTSRGK